MFKLVHTNLATLSLLALVLCLIFELPQNLLSLRPDSTKVVPLLLKAHEIARMPKHLSHHVYNLSNTTGAFNPKFYTSGSNVDIVWENSNISSSVILFKKSIDGGNVFGPEILLSKYEQHSVHPQISGSGSNLYVVWQHSSLAIVLRKSTDNGATFGPTEKVVDTTAYAQDLQVAAAGDNVYILWKDGSTESIFFKSSIDGGLTFGPSVKLSNITAAAASDLKIAAAGSNVYVLWKDLSQHNHYSILLRESMDTGISFRPAVKLSNITAAASDLKIAAAGSNVYALWTDMLSGNFSILLKGISNNGAIYAHPTVLATNGFEPDLSASGNSVYVVWDYVNNYNNDSCGAIVTGKTEKENIQGRGGGIYLVRSNNSGTVFGPPLKLSNSSAASELEITADGPNIYTLWKEDDVVLRSSADNGTTFGPEIDMNKYYGSSINLSNAMNLKLTSSASPEYKDNTNSNSKSVYLTWNQQPIMSTLDYGRTQSDVFFGMIQPLEYESQADYNASVYYRQPKCPDVQQTAAAEAQSGEQLLSVVQIRPPLQEAVWLYTYYWQDQLTHSLVDNLVARKINTIYFSAPQIGGWDNSSRVSDYLDFINYAKTKGMQVYGVTLEDPSFVFMTQAQLTNIFGSFINKTASVFDTYVIDVEPQAVAGADLHVYLPRYVAMSGILRNIADQYNKQIIDTVPTWYHMALKQIGISIGLNALSSNRINLIDYTYDSQSTLNNISDLRTDLSTPYIVNLMITPGQGAPQLSGQEIKQTIITLKANLLPLALDDAHYIVRLNSSLFQ